MPSTAERLAQIGLTIAQTTPRLQSEGFFDATRATVPENLGEIIYDYFTVPDIPGFEPLLLGFMNVSKKRIGNEGPKFEADVFYQDDGMVHQLGRMFIKGISCPRPKEQLDPSWIFRKWRMGQKLHLPVTQTMLISQDGSGVLMSEVTKQGKLFLIDRHTVESGQPIPRLSNLESIRHQLLATSQTAFNGGEGIFLSYESYSVLVDHFGVGQLALLDLGLGSLLLHENFALEWGGKYDEDRCERAAQKFIDNCLIPSQN